MVTAISPDSIRTTNDAWDVVVLGAGPAGSFAARQLASAGIRTLLVDRCAFPRPKVCGACVNQHALTLLAHVGLSDLVHRLDGVPLRQWQLRSSGRCVRVPLSGGLAVSRSRFDAALAEEATAAGAVFLPGTAADVLPARAGTAGASRAVRLMHGGWSDRIIHGRIVLAADGLGHPSLRRTGEFHSQVAPAARIGVGATLHENSSSWERHLIYMGVGSGGYVGLVRVEDGSLNVAAAVDAAVVKRAGGPAAAAAAILNDAGFPPLPSLAAADWRGTPPLSRVTSPPAGQRIFLLGDAAGYVEPFTGEGIAWAIESASLVVPLVLEGLAGWSSRLIEAWTRIHHRRIVRRQSLCRLLASGVRHPRAVRGLISLLSLSPKLSRQVIQSITGSATARSMDAPRTLAGVRCTLPAASPRSSPHNDRRTR